MRTKIILSEQILAGNFAGDTDEEQMTAAEKFRTILETDLVETVRALYPEAKIETDFEISGASGCGRGFCVYAESFDGDGDIYNDREIIHAVETEYEFIAQSADEIVYE